MSHILKTALVTATLLGSSVAGAADCMLSINRNVCLGKENAALRIHDGKNPTNEKTAATSVEQCMQDARNASKIEGRGVLSKQTVMASFDGRSIGTVEGTQSCM